VNDVTSELKNHDENMKLDLICIKIAQAIQNLNNLKFGRRRRDRAVRGRRPKPLCPPLN